VVVVVSVDEAFDGGAGGGGWIGREDGRGGGRVTFWWFLSDGSGDEV
jgi:hypothetical protein